MGMKRAICFTLTFVMLMLCGCSSQEQEILYLLTEMVEVNDEGDVLFRMTYSYDGDGLVTGYEIDDHIIIEGFDAEEMVFVTDYLPCDGVVDRSGSYAYNDHGNLVDVTDEWFLHTLDGRRIDYTYDRNGRIESYTVNWTERQFVYDLEYDDEVVRCWQQGRDGSVMVGEYVYEDEKLKSIHYPRLMTGAETHVFEYEGECMVRHIFEDRERLFTYDQDGHLLTCGDHRFSYEEGMLASIDGDPFEVETRKDGTLEARYRTYVMTYMPVVLKEADARKAQSVWRSIFGEDINYGLQERDIWCGVVHPHALMDTVLMIPRHIYR